VTERKAWSLVALFFLLHVVLALPVLTPRLKDIGAFDEAGYVEMGRTLGLHNLPALNEYPLPALFFALTYIPVHTSDFWFVHSCALGRFLLLLLLWLSAYIAARQNIVFTSHSAAATGLLRVTNSTADTTAMRPKR